MRKGEISPCVYLNPPINQIPRIFCGEKTVIPRLSYGNIEDNSLIETWARELTTG